MPPPPELGDRLGDIGVVEVAEELEAQHPAQAHGHVGVAGEVEVQLQGEGHHTQPRPRHGELVGGQGQDRIPQLADVVGQQHLFGQTHGEHLHAGGELLRRVGAVVHLVGQLLVLDDGAGDELGEQGDEGAEAHQVFGQLRVSPVDVHRVGHGLEGVEGDADGQGQFEGRHHDAEALEGVGHQHPVFEEEQDGQVQAQGDAHRPPGPLVVAPGLAPVDDDAGKVVQHDGEEHQQDVDRLTPPVEHQVDHQ